MSNNWSAATDWETVCKRNAGRRHYNAVRQFRRAYRRKQVIELLAKYPLTDHGTRTKIARALGVHRSTITRDLQCLMDRHAICPCCGFLVPRERLPPAHVDRFIPDEQRPVIYEMPKPTGQ